MSTGSAWTLDREQGPKEYNRGTQRAVAPRRTLDLILPHASRMGITRIANVTGLDVVGIPVAVAIRPNARSVSVAQGKGTGLEAAKASALMESVEQYHAENIGIPRRFMAYDRLKGSDIVVDPCSLPMRPNGVYRSERSLFWISATDIVKNCDVLVPYELVHTDYRLPREAGSGCFLRTSNGLASGNNFEEALSHAICEIIERDALYAWEQCSYEKKLARKLDAATLRDDDCRMLMGKFDAAQIDVQVFDVTADVAIPTFLCEIRDVSFSERSALYSFAGSGCHPESRIALARALTEAAQGRLTVISGSRDDLPRRAFEDGAVAPREDTFGLDGKRRFEETASCARETVAMDIEVELRLLEQSGFHHVLVVDLSKDEFGIAVVRVVIPRMRQRGQMFASWCLRDVKT